MILYVYHRSSSFIHPAYINFNFDLTGFQPVGDLATLQGDGPCSGAVRQMHCVQKSQKTDLEQVEDAKAAMDIFLTVREEYEQHLAKGGDVSGIPPSYAKWYW